MFKSVLVGSTFVGVYLVYDKMRDKLSKNFDIDSQKIEKDVFNKSILTERVDNSNFLNKNNEKARVFLKLGYFTDALLAGEYNTK